MGTHDIPGASGGSAAAVIADAVRRWRHGARAPLIVGLCGPPGAGKSTIAAAIAAGGARVATLSLDDLYLAHDARARLAAAVHPLLATRGVPGTHDMVLGTEVLARLTARTPAALPRFDKIADEPEPVARWPVVERADVVVFEGWCVGAVPQAPAALAAPVNALEAERDADGTWRRFVNAALAGPYAGLFAGLDRLVLLRPPDFATVIAWRQDAERHRPVGRATMTDAQVVGFLAHYERLSRWIDAEMPGRADLVLSLAGDRTVAEARFRG